MIISSCQISKPRAKKKLTRIVTLYPDLIEKDTVTVLDTIVSEKKVMVPKYQDSFIIEHDTIIETKEVIIEKKGNGFKFIVKEKEIIVRDTIIRKIQIPGKILKVKEVNWLFIGLSFVAGLLFIIIFLKKI